MIYGSVFSGIEAASVAWEPIGFIPAWFAEIEPFPSSVLAHHWPHIKNLGDMTKIADMIKAGNVAAPDILVGGSPCQSFSLAGLRLGLDDHRGQLTLEFVRLADEIDNKRVSNGLAESVIVWENVPGVLSSKDNAFGCFLAALAGEDEELIPSGKKWPNAGFVLGPKRAIAWRVLDAQYFGVPQRRRRVFVVASARNGFDPSQVLFEFEGVRRDSPPCREQKESIARTLEASIGRSRGAGISQGTLTVSGGCWWDGGQISQTLDAVLSKGQCMPEKNRFPAVIQNVFSSSGAGYWKDGVGPLRAQQQDSHEMLAVAFAENSRGEVRLEGGDGQIAGVLSTGGGKPGQGHPTIAYGIPGNWIGRSPKNGGNATQPHYNVSPCLTKTDIHGVVSKLAVRRLTPTECERLQGFPDGHTLVPHRGKPALDGPRYKALGNSMAVPCMRWIGNRIKNQLEQP